MGSIWTLADVKELDFAAAATLLAIHAKNQSLVSTEGSLEDSSDEDESDLEEDSKSTAAQATSSMSAHSRIAHINKFLDRLAEIFARAKSIPGTRGQQDSKHIAATAWIEASATSPLTIIVAKNEGLDHCDQAILSRLQLWLRSVAATGRHPQLQSDKLWMGDANAGGSGTASKRLGLVEYSRSRLEYHIGQVNRLCENHERVSTMTDKFGSQALAFTEFRRLCRSATPSSTVMQLSEIVGGAFKLRRMSKTLQINKEHSKLLRSICMLGRLQEAYECLRSAALTFEGIAQMELTALKSPQTFEVDLSAFRPRLERLRVDLQLPKRFLKTDAARKYIGASCLHVHAEMQVLASLAEKADWHRSAHRYIGISKKSCFMCDQMLQNYSTITIRGARRPTFKIRQCHGKVYPLWSLPAEPIAPCSAALAMSTAAKASFDSVWQHLQRRTALQPAIAESSAGVTSIASEHIKLRRQYLESHRSTHPTDCENVLEKPVALGPVFKSVKVGLLPADGSVPRLVPVTFHALPMDKDSRIRECGFDLVPNLNKFWGQSQHERRYWSCTDDRTTGNINYRVYWNENPGLPENFHVKNVLGLEVIDTMRRFWYGDVFIVQYSEDPKSFAQDVHDLPARVPQAGFFDKTFRSMWADKYLEEELAIDQLYSANSEKINADKAIILSRMTPVERDIVKRMPNMLEILTITGCDDGALADFDARPDPQDPSMVQVTSWHERTALESLDWEGFQSSQL